MQMIRFILNSYKDKYKYVYVYTMFERVNEIAIKQQPWKWEQIIEIRKMAKGWVSTNTFYRNGNLLKNHDLKTLLVVSFRWEVFRKSRH